MKTTKDTICEAVVEAQAANFSLKRISEVAEISIRTLQRWLQRGRGQDRIILAKRAETFAKARDRKKRSN